MARFVLDRTRCVSSGQCFFAAPELFPIDDNGVPEHAEGSIESGLEDKSRRAAASCPMNAILIIDKD